MSIRWANVYWHSVFLALILALGTLMVSCNQVPSKPKWIFQIHGQFYPVMSSVVADSDKYYIGLDAESILALNRDDGTLEWRVDIASEDVADGNVPANLWVSDLWLSGNLLYVVHSHTRVSVIDTESGYVVDDWMLPQDSDYPISPHLASQNTIVLGSDRGSVSAISLPTGDPMWETVWETSDERAWALPVSSSHRGVLCVGDPVGIGRHNEIGLTHDTPIKYLSLDTGEEMWQITGGTLAEVQSEEFPGGGYLGDFQAIEAFDTLYVAVGHTLSAVSRESGSLMWQHMLTGKLKVLTVLDSHSLIAVSSETSSRALLSILDAQSGQVVSKHEIGQGENFLAFSDPGGDIAYVLAWRIDTEAKIPKIVTDVYQLDIANDDFTLVRTVLDDVVHFDAKEEAILSVKVEDGETVFRLQSSSK